MATTIQYKVKRGDTLSSLGIPAEILKANPGLSKLSAGAVINIPLGMAGKSGAITSGGASLGNTGFQNGSNIIPGQQGGAMPGQQPLPGYLPGTSGGKPRQGGVPLGGLNGGMGGPPGGGPNTIWNHGGSPTLPPSGFQNGSNIVPGQGSNYGNTGFQSGANIIPGQTPVDPRFQNGSNIIRSRGGGSKWIDFQTMPPGMTWDEYNSRLAQAQAEGYKGPFLMPGADGVGQLMWDAGRPVQGAIYNDNGTVRGIGRGNITTTNTYSSNKAPRNNRSMGRGQGGGNSVDYIGQLLASNPALANDPNFQWMLQQLGGAQPPSQGNTGGNNAVNGNMNWRF